MGYTAQKTSMIIGLGVSSISDAGIAYAQNAKTLHDYIDIVNKNELPVYRGYFLNEEDIDFKKYILDISCRGNTSFNQKDLPLLESYCFPELIKLEEDGLLLFNNEGITLTPLGFNFSRNVCSGFDLKLLSKKASGDNRTYSKAI